MFLRRLWMVVRLLGVSAIFVVLIGPEWPDFQDERYRLRALVGQRAFDFVTWEAEALWAKGEAALVGGHRYLDAGARREIALEYLALTGRARALSGEIDILYTDPDVYDPAGASATLREELATVRSEIAELQPVAEAVLEAQVSTILAEEGFDVAARTWPPVQAHLTQLPFILIVSPRDEIRRDYGIPLEHGLTTPEKEELEEQVYTGLDHAALVVPIGGLGIFPAMVVETGNLNWLVNTFAHEWAHHWLTLKPLGFNYNISQEMRTINETVASILGDEIGVMVVERYYPELVPPLPAPAPPVREEPAGPPPFDFREEMRITRVEVDQMLAQGQVEAAEAYMEARRQIFWENGYQIRKLNQAYFAFYGAYADTAGATGEDPVGPAVVAIRELSPTLRDFMDAVAPVTSFEELQEVLAELQ